MRSRPKLAVIVRAVPVLSIVGMVGCTSPGISSAPMAAASGVARADAGKGLRESRIIPLKSMAGDVEILYGDPEVPGEPFVMRIRELPGTIVPPHSHPVDENITVVEGTWYFGLGEEYKAETLQELKAGSYAFAPKGSTMFGYSADGRHRAGARCRAVPDSLARWSAYAGRSRCEVGIPVRPRRACHVQEPNWQSRRRLRFGEDRSIRNRGVRRTAIHGKRA